MHASSVRPGMAMFTEDGGYDIVESRRARPTGDRDVFDLNVDAHAQLCRERPRRPQLASTPSAARTSRTSSTFEDDFPDAHVVKLEQNYRSTQTILSAANAVVVNNRGRMDKALWTDIGEGDPIRVRELADEHAEARFVAAEIERMVDEGVSRAEIAVFYRTNAQSRVLEDMLVRAQIGYQVIGGTKFYERAEIRDLVSYLTFLVNPQDANAFTRVANSPRRGLGQTSLSRVLSHADTMGIPVWDAAAEPGSVPGLGTAAQKALGRFMATMERLRERVEGGAPAGDVLSEVLSETGYTDALEAERTIEAQGRIENLEELVRVAREYDATAEEGGSLGEFLQQIALLADADCAPGRRGPRDPDDDAQREGPRVPDRVHDRDGGRRLPALARARRGRPGGGAPARLRRHHPRDARPHAHLRPPPQLVRRRPVLRHPLALHRRDPARADRPAGARARRPADRPDRHLVRRGRGLRGGRPAAATPRARSSASATT